MLFWPLHTHNDVLDFLANQIIVFEMLCATLSEKTKSHAGWWNLTFRSTVCHEVFFSVCSLLHPYNALRHASFKCILDNKGVTFNVTFSWSTAETKGSMQQLLSNISEISDHLNAVETQWITIAHLLIVIFVCSLDQVYVSILETCIVYSPFGTGTCGVSGLQVVGNFITQDYSSDCNAQD